MKGRIYQDPVQGSWIVRFGKVSKRFKILKDAERFLTGLRFKSDEGSFDARDYRRSNPLSFTNLSEKWRIAKKAEARLNSYRSICNHLRRAQDHFKDTNVKEIQYADLDDFIKAQEDIGNKTKHNILATIHSFYVWMRRRQEIHEIPEFPEVKFVLGYRRTVDKDLQQAILDDIEKHEPFKVYLGIRFLSTYISCRPMEIMNLLHANVDVKNGYIYIPEPKEKKYKSVPILPEDGELLAALPRTSMYVFGEDGKRFGCNRFYKAWKRACARLKIEGVDLYGGTRHSSARALRSSFSPEQIKRASMHSSNAAFERYFKMESDDVRSIYQKSAKVVNIQEARKLEEKP